MNAEPSDVDEIRNRRRADRRSRRRRWAGRVAVTLLVSLTGLLVWQTIQWQITRRAGEKRLAAAIAETDAADPNWRLDQLMAERNRSLPPPEQNAAEQAYKAASAIPRGMNRWQQNNEWRGKLKLGHLPDVNDLEDVRAMLAEVEDALELARTVKRYPTGGFALTLTEPDPLRISLAKAHELRATASLLDFDALVRASDNRGDDALDSVHAILATGRGLGDEPTSISMLVRMAIAAIAVWSAERVLGLCETSDAKLAELQSMFAAEAEVPRLAYASRGDRAVYHRLIENIDNGSLSLESVSGTPRAQTLREKLLSLPHRAVIPEQQAMYLEFWNRILASAKMPYGPPRRAAVDSVLQDIRSVPKAKYPLVVFLFPAVNRIDEADTRAAATMRATTVALACERFRLKSGRFPESLDELPKQMLSEVPADPYTSRPLLYKKADDGAVVYCTGPDETDDGGELDPVPAPGTDIGFRLFDPAHRRKPPRPKEE